MILEVQLIYQISYHPSKNASFDILSLADQLHRSKSVTPDGPEPRKIYFSENPVADLLAEGLEAFEKNITLYNKSVDRKEHGITAANGEQASNEEIQEIQASEFRELKGDNERVNKIFNAAQELAFVATNQGF